MSKADLKIFVPPTLMKNISAKEIPRRVQTINKMMSETKKDFS